jgi:hypothetical protein
MKIPNKAAKSMWDSQFRTERQEKNKLLDLDYTKAMETPHYFLCDLDHLFERLKIWQNQKNRIFSQKHSFQHSSLLSISD